jgi:hypothetical protein
MQEETLDIRLEEPFHLLLLGSAYFFPTFVAIGRESHSFSKILAVNVFFGWTGIGWFYALCWATFGQGLGDDKKAEAKKAAQLEKAKAKEAAEAAKKAAPAKSGATGAMKSAMSKNPPPPAKKPMVSKPS